MNLPLVTCLCNTRNRAHLLNRTVDRFKWQTYPEKELLIIYEEDDTATDAFAAQLNEPHVRFLKMPVTPKLTLGALRNAGIADSRGDLVCIWDDDDWYHPRRIEVQVSHLLASHKAACIMAYILLYDAHNVQAYLGHMRLWEGSMICQRDVLKDDLYYGDMNKQEDQFLVDRLKANNMVYPLIMPQLYVYVIHGNNTWHSAHFSGMFSCSQKMSEESSLLIKQIVEQGDHPDDVAYIDSPAVLSQLNYDLKIW